MSTIRTETLKDGKTVYRAQFRRKGFDGGSFQNANKRKVKSWLTEQERQYEASKGIVVDDGRRRTLGDLIDRYLEDNTEGRDPVLALRLEWWRAQLGTASAGKVTELVVATYCDKLRRGTDKPGAKKRSPASVNRYKQALSSCLTHAVKLKLLRENVALKVPKLKEPRGRTRWLNDEERERLLAACEASSWPGLIVLVHLALATGVRLGNLLALEWRHVDLDRAVLHLEQTKNDEPHAAPIVGPALPLLREWARVRHIDSPLVFPGKRNPYKPFSFRPHWTEARAAAGVSDFTFHDLKHTLGSYLAQANINTRTIADVLQHKTLAMAQRYSHLAVEHRTEATEKALERLK